MEQLAQLIWLLILFTMLFAIVVVVLILELIDKRRFFKSLLEILGKN